MPGFAQLIFYARSLIDKVNFNESWASYRTKKIRDGIDVTVYPSVIMTLSPTFRPGKLLNECGHATHYVVLNHTRARGRHPFAESKVWHKARSCYLSTWHARARAFDAGSFFRIPLYEARAMASRYALSLLVHEHFTSQSYGVNRINLKVRAT